MFDCESRFPNHLAPPPGLPPSSLPPGPPSLHASAHFLDLPHPGAPLPFPLRPDPPPSLARARGEKFQPGRACALLEPRPLRPRLRFRANLPKI
ncbi:hypothetical protein GUJ93_ZPchr0006g43535 [Zizania palustris]|uniref:Uncharacterized protein n=1 Tax=Zizania palustris TaxID=103762 RepID=A0A8J5SQF6_ZIZPA|nr:hypothetical protein GUJ93_ZPchr0006g43535 [Zizania palustris]